MSTSHRAVVHRSDLTITVHDADPQGRLSEPQFTVDFRSDLDAALAGAAFVRTGRWVAGDGVLIAEIEHA